MKYTRGKRATIVDGDKRTPVIIVSGYLYSAVGSTIEACEQDFRMLTPPIMNPKTGELSQPATYDFLPSYDTTKLKKFTSRADGSIKLAGSRSIELVFDKSEVTQEFK